MGGGVGGNRDVDLDGTGTGSSPHGNTTSTNTGVAALSGGVTVQLPSGAVITVGESEAVALVNFAGGMVLQGLEADGALERQIREQSELLKEAKRLRAQGQVDVKPDPQTTLQESMQRLAQMRKHRPSRIRQHTKVVKLEPSELWGLTASRLFALGVIVARTRRFCVRRRRTKMFCLGLGRLAVKRRNASRAAVKLLAVGLPGFALRQRAGRMRAMCVYTLGLMPQLLVEYQRLMETTQAMGFLGRRHRPSKADTKRRIVAGMWKRASKAAILQEKKKNPAKKKKKKKDIPAKVSGPKLKPIHWDVMKKVKGTIWDTSDGLYASSVDFDVRAATDKLETLFCLQSRKKKTGHGSGGAHHGKSKAASQRADLLDGKMAQNLGITVRSRYGKANLNDIAAAAKLCDVEAFGGSDAAEVFLASGCCDPEVMKKVNAFAGDESRLNLAEKFIKIVVCGVPAIQQRLETMVFLSGLEKEVARHDADVEVLLNACQEIRASERLRTLLLDVMLPLGNFLNRGSKKGTAKGIKLNALKRIAETKANNGQSLMRFIANLLVDNESELLRVHEDLPSLDSAKVVNSLVLQSDVAKLASKISVAKAFSEACQSRGEAEVSKRLDSVLDAAATRLDGVKSKLRFFDTAFKSLLRYFGDKKGQPAETFEKVALIIDQLRLDVSKYQELKAKEAKKAAREARRLAAKNNSSTTRQHKKKKKKHHKHTKPTPSSDSTGADNAPVASEGTSAGVGTGEQKQPADTTEDKQVPHSVADADADEAKDTVGSLPASPSKQRRRSIPFKKVKRKSLLVHMAAVANGLDGVTGLDSPSSSPRLSATPRSKRQARPSRLSILGGVAMAGIRLGRALRKSKSGGRIHRTSRRPRPSMLMAEA